MGALPFEPARRGVLATVSETRAQDPSRPSARLVGLGASASDVAQKRATDVTSLTRELAGDLDWITLKAMEHDRARRYASASELASDIERYLARQPILARPPSLGYRARKFADRHRVGVFAAGVVLVALLAGIAAASVGLVRARRAEAQARAERARAEREAAQARAVNDFLRDVLGAAEPWQLGRDAKVVDALARSAKRLEAHELPPELEAAVRDTIGTTYQRLGDLPSAAREIERSLEMRQRLLGPEHPDTLTSEADLAALRQAEGHFDEAIRIGREVLSLRRKVLGPDHADTTTTLNDLAVALFQAGQPDEAEELIRQAWQIRKRVLGPSDPKTLFAESNLASLLESRQRSAEAEPLLREVLAEQERQLGKAHSNTIFTRKSLGRVLQDEGKLDEAERAYREALQDSRRTSGLEHVDTLVTASDYAQLLEERGKLGEAETLLRETLRTAEATLPKGHRFTDVFRRNLGECLAKAGRFAEAEALLLAARTSVVASGNTSDLAAVDRRLVRLYEAWGKPEKAAHYREAAPKP